MTYIRTGEGWLYLATVIDLASRRLIGWSMGARHDAHLVVDALKMAVAARDRRTMDGTIFHHDRGSEHTSDAFRTACNHLGVTQSAGRTGSCLGNVVAESFFATLKVELVHRLHLPTQAVARQAIFVWVHRYNHRQRHCTTGMIRPPSANSSNVRPDRNRQRWPHSPRRARQPRPLTSVLAAHVRGRRRRCGPAGQGPHLVWATRRMSRIVMLSNSSGQNGRLGRSLC